MRLVAISAAILVAATGIKIFLIQPFRVAHASMQNTLQPGDVIVVNKIGGWLGSSPNRGDIIVFNDPGGWLPNPESRKGGVLNTLKEAVGFTPPSGIIKRVIAIGGDAVTCDALNGPLRVNGKPIDEPYIHSGDYQCGYFPNSVIKVPEGHLWVMGDHRNKSSDSRSHVMEKTGGFVPVEKVIGVVIRSPW
jgi:signal peptidase I